MTRACALASDTIGDEALAVVSVDVAGRSSPLVPSAGRAPTSLSCSRINVPSDPVISETALVSRVDRRSGLDRSEGTARELEDRGQRVLDVDAVQPCCRSAVDTRDRSEQPDHQIECVDGLIHQRAAAVEGRRAAPPRPAVVLGRAIPFDAAGNHHRRAELAAVEGLLHLAHRRTQPILEEDAELDARRVGRIDEGVGAFRS